MLSMQGSYLAIPVRCVVCAQKIPLSLPFSYVSVSHDFHPQQAAAAACRPHIMLSTFCDLQLRRAEHPHPLKGSGAPDHHCGNTKNPATGKKANKVKGRFSGIQKNRISAWTDFFCLRGSRVDERGRAWQFVPASTVFPKLRVL